MDVAPDPTRDPSQRRLLSISTPPTQPLFHQYPRVYFSLCALSCPHHLPVENPPSHYTKQPVNPNADASPQFNSCRSKVTAHDPLNALGETSLKTNEMQWNSFNKRKKKSKKRKKKEKKNRAPPSSPYPPSSKMPMKLPIRRQPTGLDLQILRYPLIRAMCMLAQQLLEGPYFSLKEISLCFQQAIFALKEAASLNELLLFMFLFAAAFAGRAPVLFKVDGTRGARFDVFGVASSTRRACAAVRGCDGGRGSGAGGLLRGGVFSRVQAIATGVYVLTDG